jgi:hypothetical protein
MRVRQDARAAAGGFTHLVVALALCGWPGGRALAQSCPTTPTGCPEIQNTPPAVKPGSTVSYKVIGTPPAGVSTDLSNAQSTVNGASGSSGNNTGDTFNTTTSSSAYTITFDTTTTNPTCGNSNVNVVSCNAGTVNSKGVRVGSSITIYLAAQCDNGAGGTMACFPNSGSTDWNNEVQSVITHEMMHDEGTPDLGPGTTTDPNDIMSPLQIENPQKAISSCDNSITKLMATRFADGTTCPSN